MSTTSSMPKVTGPIKEAAGFTKEELGEKLADPKMAQEGRDLRNRGRMEQGKDILVGTPGLGVTKEAGQSTLMDDMGGMTGTAKKGCVCNKAECIECTNAKMKAHSIPPPPLLNEVKQFNKSNLEHVETIDKTHSLPIGHITTAPPTVPPQTAMHAELNPKESHQIKGAAEMSLAKDSNLPFTERVGHGLSAVAEKTKAIFSSTSSTSTTTTQPSTAPK